MKQYNSKYNVHHGIARAKGGSNHHDNRIDFKKTKHNGIHFVFNNKLPHEQTLETLEYNEPTYTEEAVEEIKQAIFNIMSKHLKKGTLYNKKCFRRPNYIPTKI